jgi:hypothetical protein
MFVVRSMQCTLFHKKHKISVRPKTKKTLDQKSLDDLFKWFYNYCPDNYLKLLFWILIRRFNPENLEDDWTDTNRRKLQINTKIKICVLKQNKKAIFNFKT